MTQATSTHPLTYFADSPEIREICEDFGDRLGVLSGIEKNHLVMALAGTLAHWRMLAVDALDESDEDEDEFADLFDEQDDEESTIEGWAAHNICVELSGDVLDVIRLLEPLEPAKIAAILPAIAQYAAEDDR